MSLFEKLRGNAATGAERIKALESREMDLIGENIARRIQASAMNATGAQQTKSMMHNNAMNAAHSTAYQGLGSPGNITATNPHWGTTAVSSTLYVQTPPRFDANKSAAMQMSLVTLIDLTRVKYGERWLDTQTPIPVEDDDFWTDAFARLKAAGKLEDVRGWIRLKEGA